MSTDPNASQSTTVIEGEIDDDESGGKLAVRAPSTTPAEREVAELVAHADKIKLALAEAMQKDVHYGVIPGVQKPSLYKPGAEHLLLLFKLDPEYESERTWMPPIEGELPHLDVTSRCTLYHQPTGNRLGSGEGSCSTMESRYRWRTARRKCPECGAEQINRSRYADKETGDKGWYCFKKKGGCGATFHSTDERIVSQPEDGGRSANQDLPDQYNTVLKMANKRALVAAVLNVTAASDVFTQDVEDAKGQTPGDEQATPPEPRVDGPEPVQDSLTFPELVERYDKYVNSPGECDSWLRLYMEQHGKTILNGSEMRRLRAVIAELEKAYGDFPDFDDLETRAKAWWSHFELEAGTIPDDFVAATKSSEPEPADEAAAESDYP